MDCAFPGRCRPYGAKAFNWVRCSTMMPHRWCWIAMPRGLGICGCFGRREVVEARPGKGITHGRNPVGVDEGWGMMTQGRRWGANLGLWAKIPLGFEGSAVA